MRAISQYIIENPLRLKLVEHVGAYSWWDAVWLDTDMKNNHRRWSTG